MSRSKQDSAGDMQVVRASGGVRVFVDQAVQDGFSADLLCVDVGHGGAGSATFWAAPRFPDSIIGAISCCELPVQVLVEGLLRGPVPER